MTLRIVGFNLSHDSSVCLVEDGQVRAALALERTTQVKRGLVPAHAYATAMADLTQQVAHARVVIDEKHGALLIVHRLVCVVI